MSEAPDDLSESARNRGLKLVRSRVRSAGKAGFGKVGLTDAAGAPVFGMEGGRPAADPRELAGYLRGIGVSDWRASLGAEGPASVKLPRSRQGLRRRAPKDDPPAGPAAPEPRPDPVAAVRVATRNDAAAIEGLIGLLGHEVDEGGIRDRLLLLAAAGEAPLVATMDGEVVGLCGLHRMTVVHRPRPVGRIAILVIAETVRGKGLGRRLVEAAEAALAAAGCELIEVTSNDRLSRAHAFYRHLGFERTSMRFVRQIGPAASL